MEHAASPHSLSRLRLTPLPMCLCVSAVACCVSPPPLPPFSVFAVVLNVLVAQSLGLYLGAAVMNPKTAQTIASVIMLAFMLVGGYYVRVSEQQYRGGYSGCAGGGGRGGDHAGCVSGCGWEGEGGHMSVGGLLVYSTTGHRRRAWLPSY